MLTKVLYLLLVRLNSAYSLIWGCPLDLGKLLVCERRTIGISFLSYFDGILTESNTFTMYRRENIISQAYQDYLPNSTLRILTDILLSILATSLVSVLPVLKHMPNLKYVVQSCLVLVTRNFRHKIVSGEVKQSTHNMIIF